VAQAERALFDLSGSCRFCHQAKESPRPPTALPEYAPSGIKRRWFEGSSFRHESHHVLRCAECHGEVEQSRSAGDVLFLAGPRFGKYLVPVTCRSCLDPVCLIGCPVGSIHRGDGRQIVIEDWCIGCGLCGSQCPYGSIQLHDVGIIPEGARGWRYLPASAVPQKDWFEPRFLDGGWAPAVRPIVFDREFKEELTRHLKGKSPPEVVSAEQAFYFLYEFELGTDPVRLKGKFRLEITSAAKAVALWVNGRESAPDKEQRGKREYYLPKQEANAGPVFRKGRRTSWPSG
jgi:NAD-dependent dihydropyrimidine dehydrogenase PreA subunit